MHIRTLGNTVQLCRWQVQYTTTVGESSEPVTDYVPTDEEADLLVSMYNGTKTRLETASDEWIDGIEVESLDKAREIAAMGEQGYKAWQAKQTMQSPEMLAQQLHAAQLALVDLHKQILEAKTANEK